MAVDKKHGTFAIRNEVGTDEPIFIIRGKDACSVRAILAYARIANDAGATPEFGAECNIRAIEFQTWQNQHRDEIRIPD